MLNTIAFVTSIIFSPFFVPIGTILVLALKYTTRWQAFWCCTIIILFISVIPGFFIFTLFRLGKLSDLRLATQEQRFTPLCFLMASGLVGTCLLSWIGAPKEIVWTGIAYVVNGVVFTAITPFWKISFHTGVSAGCVTVLWLLSDRIFGWLFVLLPLIGWARVHRERHTPLQTVVAVLVSIASIALAHYLFYP